MTAVTMALMLAAELVAWWAVKWAELMEIKKSTEMAVSMVVDWVLLRVASKDFLTVDGLDS